MKEEKNKMIGLHQTIGYQPEVDSAALKKVLRTISKSLNLSSKERLEVWEKELSFWEGYSKVYKNLEKTGPYRDLCATVESFINPTADSVWLDAGCGPASMSKILWEKSGGKIRHVVGMDLVIKPAQERIKCELKNMPLKLACGNVGEKTKFRDATFDGIISNLVYPYIFDFHGLTGKEALIQTLSEACRILKPGGQLAWSTPKKNVNFWWVFLASVPAMLNPIEYLKGDFTRFYQGIPIIRHALQIQEKGRMGFYTFMDPDEATSVMEKIGFSTIRWEKTFANQAWVYSAIKQ